MGESEILGVQDLWIFGPLGTLICGFEYTKLIQKYKKTPNSCLEIFCFNGFWEFENVDIDMYIRLYIYIYHLHLYVPLRSYLHLQLYVYLRLPLHLYFTPQHTDSHPMHQTN